MQDRPSSYSAAGHGMFDISSPQKKKGSSHIDK